MIPTLQNIQDAARRISPHIINTPIMRSEIIDEIAGCNIHFKCENFQRIGAFKARGAINAVFSLSDEEARNGVATHSSGNHAQALALAAQLRGISATIIMPSTANKVKMAGVRRLNANIIECEPNQNARETALNEFITNFGGNVIHPYTNPLVISGQGTAALEIITELNDFDAIICPVGGGGLLSGTAICTKSLLPNAKVIAAEPLGANDAYLSFNEKTLYPSINPQTICDGLLTSLGEINYEIILQNVDSIITADDLEIINAMKLIWQHLKIIVEPSSATVLAAIIRKPEIFSGKKVAAIISGGNVDLDNLPW